MSTSDPRQPAGDATGNASRDTVHEEVQEELRREAKEGADSIGDVSSNRNVTGSSSWDTLPASDETQPGRGKT